MRKETQKIAGAFIRGETARAARSRTDGESVFLHENEIAWWNYGAEKPAICFTLAGWNTRTTRDRLDGIFEYAGSRWRVCQRNFEPFLIHLDTRQLIPLSTDGRYFLPASDETAIESCKPIWQRAPYSFYELR